jgi:predicted AAA+ superfamily ATPase
MVENHPSGGYIAAMIERHLAPRVMDALADTPVVFLAGPRQCGKSTLAQSVASTSHPARYLTFDTPALLAAARRDPEGFIGGLEGSVVLDEVQRAPGVFPVIKAAVDRDRAPGRFLLTGSVSARSIPAAAEHLVGRMEILTLWPFSQGELEKRTNTFIDLVCAERFSAENPGPLSRAEIAGKIASGGYPEAVARLQPTRRAAWFESYVETIVQREVRDLAAIEGLADLPRLLRLLAARTSGLLSHADLARDATLPQTTFKRYLALLEALFLVQRLPAWSSNLGSRQVKAPKIHIVDSGLAAHLRGDGAAELATGSSSLGPLLETFVVNELMRQSSWSHTGPGLFHFRTHVGREVDLVLEDRKGQCVGVEVKSSATLGGADVAGIEAFRAAAGKRFRRGIILYLGREVVPFAADVHALPIGALWGAKNRVVSESER